jgi:Zn-dependent metalloprotease
MDKVDQGFDLKAQGKEDASHKLYADIEGVIPPYVLDELAKRNPRNSSYQSTIDEMSKLSKEGLAHPRARQDEGGKREVYDAGGQKLARGETGDKARFEGERPTGDREVDQVYDYTGNVREFYKQVFGRNSIDDNGMKFVSRVNYGQNFQNAYWDGVEMTYGRPDASSPFKTFILQDVTGHEITHGITQYESNLGYQGQSGALNESLSDVFGTLVDQWAHHTKARDAHWLIGEGIWKDSINGRALRDMLHPGTAYNDTKIGKDPQPADMAHFVNTTKDNGGVHINSGIPNRAFAEFATAVGGYAWEEPGHIWYKAREIAGSNPDFAKFADATIQAAKQLGFDNDVAKLEQAWAKVGVTPSSSGDSGSQDDGSGWMAAAQKKQAA